MVDKTFFQRMQTSEEVATWLSAMESVLTAFMEAVPQALREHLDYSVASFDYLEAWLLSQYTDLKDAYNPEGMFLIDAAGRYVGEVLRAKTGAEWYVELKQQDSAFLGFPVLQKTIKNAAGQFYDDQDYPHRLVMTSLARRTGSFMRNIAEKYIQRLGSD